MTSKTDDIKVTDVRESAYAPNDSIDSFKVEHGSIEDVNDRAWDQSFGKGGAPGVKGGK